MNYVVKSVIPSLETTSAEEGINRTRPNDVDIRRQGAAEALTCLVEDLGVRIVPYAVLFMVPLLGRMSDQNQAVRLACSSTFATLVQLLPLDPGSVADPPHLVYVKMTLKTLNKKVIIAGKLIEMLDHFQREESSGTKVFGPSPEPTQHSGYETNSSRCCRTSVVSTARIKLARLP